MRPRVKVKSHTPLLGGRLIMTEQDRSTAVPMISKKDSPVGISVLLTAAKKGVPVPIRLYAAAAGMDYDAFMENFNGKD